MSTLITDLDERVKNSPRYRADSVEEYFRTSELAWWDPTSDSYQEQNVAIAGWLKGLQPFSILELGPGFGRVTRLLDAAHPKGELTLVEVNEKGCRGLRRAFPRATVLNVGFEDFDWQEERFNLVVAIEVLVHVSDIPQLLHHVAEALPRGGHFLTSITPLSWYEQHRKRKTTIHRGIDEEEFFDAVTQLFRVVASHQSSNGQQMTVLLEK